MNLFEPQLRTEISQGDIFENVPICYVNTDSPNEKVEGSIHRCRAMMLTYDCEFDKPKNSWVVVAEVRPMSELAPDAQKVVRELRVFNAFLLLAAGEIAEAYMDLRRLDRIAKTTLFALDKEGKRQTSLTDDARAALRRHIALFFGLDR